MSTIFTLIQEPFDFHLPPADTVSLIPMNFSHSNGALGQTHAGDSLKLPPPTGAELAPQSHDIFDPTTNGNRFNLLDFTDDLKVHLAILCTIGHEINL